jgi:predicted nuclease of predicted toxin-antitoxin system
MDSRESDREKLNTTMSCRLRVDREPGLPILKALRKAGHKADQVSGLLAARGATRDEVFAPAARAVRMLVTADPSFADIGRLQVAQSPGLVLCCLQNSTLCDAVDSVYRLQLDVLQDLRRAGAEAAIAAKRLELHVGQLTASSKALYGRARQAISEGDPEEARTMLARRAQHYVAIRSMTEQWQELDESFQSLVATVHKLQSAVEVFRRETDIMKACVDPAATAMPDGEKVSDSDLESLTANFVEALATGMPGGALWLVLPNVIWEIPGPYLKVRRM